MFKRIRKIVNESLSKIENFSSDNSKNESIIFKKNTTFSNELELKLNDSSKRISEIRKSIQNTKL